MVQPLTLHALGPARVRVLHAVLPVALAGDADGGLGAVGPEEGRVWRGRAEVGQRGAQQEAGRGVRVVEEVGQPVGGKLVRRRVATINCKFTLLIC